MYDDKPTWHGEGIEALVFEYMKLELMPFVRDGSHERLKEFVQVILYLGIVDPLGTDRDLGETALSNLLLQVRR